MSKLDRWRVCKEETAMAGAAAALLSISDLGLVLDSPMWCSAFAHVVLGFDLSEDRRV